MPSPLSDSRTVQALMAIVASPICALLSRPTTARVAATSSKRAATVAEPSHNMPRLI